MYQDDVDVWVMSVISGEHHDIEKLSELRQSDIGVLREFANDNEIQYMRIASANIGFIRTYQKRHVERKAAKAGGGDE